MRKIYLFLTIIAYSFCVEAQEYISLELNTNQTGTKDYKAKESIALKPNFSYSATSGNFFHASIDPNIILNPNPGEIYGGSNAGIVGMSEGNTSVGPSGAAYYEMPIKLSPGTGGMVPQLSIAYNSQGGEGLLGTGFTLTGLSTISRCPKNIFNDGIVSGVKLDDSDPFTLDGNRLILVSGTGVYGADGSEYRTENNTFVKVKVIGNANGGPIKFMVWTKSGLIKEYGYTEDSRIQASGKANVVFWLLNKVTDTKGNYFTITYAEDNVNGEYHPSRIDYTGNSSSVPVLTPYCSVRFSYDSRMAANFSYLAGSKSWVSGLLTSIKVYNQETVIKEYQLDYNNLDGKYLLHTITEIGMNGDKYNPTTFDWYVNNAFQRTGLTDNSLDAITYVNKADITIGDYNGDGQTDFIATPQTDAGFTDIKLFLADASGTKCTYIGTSLLPIYSPNVQFIAADFDGDGKSDILRCSKQFGNTYFSLLHSTGNGFTAATHEFTEFGSKETRVGDFNGDGVADIIVYTPGSNDCKIICSKFSTGVVQPLDFSTVQLLTLPNGKKWDKVEIVDFNGDGLTDVVNFDDYGYQLLTRDDAGFMLFTQATWPTKKYDMSFGDFNGDGKTDILLKGLDGTDWSTWQIQLSTGIGFEQFDFPHLANAHTKQLFVGDMNGDGRDDFFELDKDGDAISMIPIFLAKGNGTSFNYQAGESAYSLKRWKLQTGDFNGDGRMDNFITSNQNTWAGYILTTETTDRDRLLKSITDGMGNVTSLTYKPVTDNSLYAKYNNGVYPLCDIEGAFQVVAVLTRPNGIGGTLVTNYKYEGAKIHKRGKGFLGFTKFTATDVQSGISTISYYDIEPTKFIPWLKRSETRITKGDYFNKLLTEADYTYSLQSYQTGVYTYQQTNVVEKKYELAAANAYSQTTTTYTYDSYGNVLTTNQSLKDPAATLEEASVLSTNEYDNDETKWFLGRLKKVTVVKKSAGQQDITRVSQFEYDATSGLLIKEIVEPGNVDLGYNKVYEHDVFGNLLKSTTTAGSVNRFIQSKYDDQGRFETETSNILNHKSTKVFNPFFGVVTSQTDPNGLIATTEFDGFGKASKSVNTDGVKSIVAARWCNGDEGGPANAIYYVHSERSDAPPVIEFFDRLGRSVRKIGIGFDGTRIFIDIEYDSYGRAYRKSDPYFEGEMPLWTTLSFDELGRVITKTLPGSPQSGGDPGNLRAIVPPSNNTVITITYNGLTTTTQNPLLQTDTRKVNQRGLLIESMDNNGKKVTYVYNSSGNLIETHDPKGNVVKMEYDLLGNRTKLIDPDLGTVTSKFNAFGELVSELGSKPNAQAVTSTYDEIGRIKTVTEAEGVTTWTYDTQPKGIGKLTRISKTNGISKVCEYDELGRTKHQSETIDGITYDIYTSYDVYGRVFQVTYPKDPSTLMPLSVKNKYNKYGFLETVLNANDGSVYWIAEKMNAHGQLEQFKFGNNLRTNRTYNTYTGLLETIITPGADEAWVQNWSYAFNKIGTLTQRKDLKRSLTEDFHYDNLNRLTEMYKNNSLVNSVTYDEIGNILTKSDVGTYTYGSSENGPHALQSIITYTGIILSTATQNINYTSFDKVRSIWQAADSMVFAYGTGYERKQVDTYKNNSLKSQKYYVGNLYEREKDITTGEIKETHYIFAAGSAIAIYTRLSAGTTNTRYLHQDHLGSIQCITDETGHLVQELSYDAWGNRRDVASWVVYTTLPTGILLSRGFTGHEHVDLFGLINMDGRVYDPVIGRFLSADPIIQNPGNLQSLNRYSYCVNNPLSLTDPSGYTWLSDNWRTIVAAAVSITVSVITAGGASGLGVAILSGAAGGFAGGFTGTLLSGSDLGQAFKAGIIGGLIGGASGFLNFASGFASSTNKVGAMFERVAKHSISNAMLNGSTGGDFKHGFVTGLFSTLGNQLISDNVFSEIPKVTCAAVLGGTIEEIGGGKFANGAITGAYGMLFNDLMHEIRELKFVRAYIQISLNSGVGAFRFTIDGVPIGAVYNFGGSEQLITMYVDIYTTGDIELGGMFTQKQIESGSGSVTLGPYTFESPETSKQTDYYFTSENGSGIKKTPWNTSLGAVGGKSVSMSGNGTVTKIEISAKIAAVILGIGVGAGVEYHWW